MVTPINFTLLLTERAKYPFDPKSDAWIEKLLEQEKPQNDIDIILPASFVTTKTAQLNSLREKLTGHRLSAISALQTPYKNSHIALIHLRFTKEPGNTIRIANFSGNVHTKKERQNTEPLTIGNWTPEYLAYTMNIMRWELSGQKPESIPKIADYSEIPDTEFDSENLNPAYYHSKAVELRKHLSEEELILLHETADIIIPRPSKEEKPTLRPREVTYPINPDNCETGKCSETLLQKGDIIISNGDSKQIALFNHEGTEQIYAPCSCKIIRPKNISPEYLCLYLKSDTGKAVSGMLTRQGCIINTICTKDLRKFPVIKPVKTDEEYVQLFDAVHCPKTVSDINQALFSCCGEKPECAADILNLELFEGLRYYKQETVTRLINDDLKEINACFNAKAYKATLILAGSVLEAFLIDWLSEIENVDYFETKEGQEKDLKEYINHIQIIRKPAWMDESKKAHKIRENRNLVHAKLCLKECREINEELCREVIGYLEEIVQSRFGTANS